MMPMNDEVEAVEGRKHIDVQTDNYLEELTDRRPEVNEETQTEAFMDRPPLPLFIPSKTGLDKETQVEDDLFDFVLKSLTTLSLTSFTCSTNNSPFL